MEGHSFFLQLIAQGCGNLAREEHLLHWESCYRVITFSTTRFLISTTIIRYLKNNAINTIRKKQVLKPAIYLLFSRPIASWSGQDVSPVLEPRHFIPFNLLITSSIFMPSIKRHRPCVLPMHPPTIVACVITPFSCSMIISLEQTLFGLNVIVAITI